jgi:hypothetical protein
MPQLPGALLVCLSGIPLLAATTQVQFHKDVMPLLQKHCQGCHRPGETAPFSMLSYKDTRPWAKAIRAAVVARKMPPWFANPAHGKFQNDARLSSREIETLSAWVDAGSPEGDPADGPKPLVFDEGWKIGKPDLIVEIPVGFQVPKDGVVDYTWLAADMKLTEDKWIEKLQVMPGSRPHVHHALVFARGPQSKYRPTLQPGSVQSRPEVRSANRPPQSDKGGFAIGANFGDTEMIGDYVPNGDPFIAGPGQGRLVRAGSHMLFQMHYTPNGNPATDRTRVGIVFAKTPPKERVVNNAVINATLRIPPGAPNHEVSALVTVQRDTRIGAFGPHMHLRGKAMRMELIRAGSEKPEVLLDIPAYDFNWQLKYWPTELITARKGDQLRVTAWYDNSQNNRYNPDPSREVFWGDQSWDEMLFAFFDYVIPADANPDEVTVGRKDVKVASSNQ